MSRGTYCVVSFSNGQTARMTLRDLCGWARQQNARVRTDDGWPVRNGKILSLGIQTLTTGVVRSPDHDETLAMWAIVQENTASIDPVHLARLIRQKAEQEWAVRS